MLRLILPILFGWSCLQPAWGASAPDNAQIKQQLEDAKSDKTTPNQAET